MSILTKLQDLRTEEEQSNNLYFTFDVSNSDALLKRITELAKIVAEHEAKWATSVSKEWADLDKGIFYTNQSIVSAPIAPTKSFYYGSHATLRTDPIVVIYECA